MAPRPKTSRHKLPQPDDRGRLRAVVGRTIDGQPARFEVGNRHTPPAEAERRLEAIRTLFARQCEELKMDCWAGWVHCWATRIAAGLPIEVEPTSERPGNCAEELGIARRLQDWGVPVRISPRLESNGYLGIRQQIEREVRQAIASLSDGWKQGNIDIVSEAQEYTAMPTDPTTAPTGTFQEALWAFSKHITESAPKGEDDTKKPNTRRLTTAIEMLVEHHEDIPLWSLDLPACERLATHWRNRPTTKRGNRCSIEHASVQIKILFRFFRWLDTQVKFRWQMPKGLDKISRKPVALADDTAHHQTAFHDPRKQTYTPQQLAIICQHTDAYHRAIIGVCANCAFGASEIGQLSTAAYQLYAKHPYAQTLGIESDDKDSWIVGKRPKTGIYGEHLLWDEVARAVQPFLDGRPVLPITKQGKPSYRLHSSNPQSGFANWWTALVESIIKKHPDFPRLPFGSLRDILPNVLRREYGDEVSSLALQHGKISSDSLLDCYANMPFAKLFTATQEMRKYFQPFLEALVIDKA